ncbi:MAG: M15 family metallopeptidase [Flavobacterium sp.]|nr:M15 family metallopeptidase [Pedobacter sp.]
MTAISILLVLCYCSYAQIANPYGLKIINDRSEYLKSIYSDSNNRLVEIVKYEPDIKLDIRYATTNNFTGISVYEEARAFVRLPVALALKAVQKELNKKGLGLKIYDAYRPYAVTIKFFEISKDKNFVASPKTGSRHNRGCAVDLTLVNIRNGKELKMPTPFDSFKPEAHPDFTKLPQKIIANRAILTRVMKDNGFEVLYNEWWHFDFKDWKNYDLMDISFKQL